MKFKINDVVAVLDDDLSGTITNIEGSEITVATSTGFDLVFDSRELVKIKENLISQLTSPVKWTQSVNEMIKSGTTNFIEIGPGKVLQGLIKKIDRNVDVSFPEL